MPYTGSRIYKAELARGRFRCLTSRWSPGCCGRARMATRPICGTRSFSSSKRLPTRSIARYAPKTRFASLNDFLKRWIIGRARHSRHRAIRDTRSEKSTGAADTVIRSVALGSSMSKGVGYWRRVSRADAVFVKTRESFWRKGPLLAEQIVGPDYNRHCTRRVQAARRRGSRGRRLASALHRRLWDRRLKTRRSERESKNSPVKCNLALVLAPFRRWCGHRRSRAPA